LHKSIWWKSWYDDIMTCSQRLTVFCPNSKKYGATVQRYVDGLYKAVILKEPILCNLWNRWLHGIVWCGIRISWYENPLFLHSDAWWKNMKLMSEMLYYVLAQTETLFLICWQKLSVRGLWRKAHPTNSLWRQPLVPLKLNVVWYMYVHCTVFI
jgi:hypothetical protein